MLRTTLIICALLALAGCKTQPVQSTDPQPTGVEYYQQGCAIYGAMSFENTDKAVVFRVPVDACGRGA